MPSDNISIRPLTVEDTLAYRALRLDALRTNPDAFSASIEDEAQLSYSDMRKRAAPEPPGIVFGAFSGDELVGMAGYVAERRPKTRHKATMVAVYVAPQYRGGIGRRLVENIIAHARACGVILQCTVSAHNERARSLYRALGFKPYGLEKDALLVDGAYYDEELLALDLRGHRDGR